PQDLNFNVPGRLNILFEIHGRVPKSKLRLLLGCRKRGYHIIPVTNDAHPAPATARRRLNDYGIPNRFGYLDSFLLILDDPVKTGGNRDPDRLHRAAGLSFVAHQSYYIWAGADEFDIARPAYLGKMRIL